MGIARKTLKKNVKCGLKSLLQAYGKQVNVNLTQRHMTDLVASRIYKEVRSLTNAEWKAGVPKLQLSPTTSLGSGN